MTGKTISLNARLGASPETPAHHELARSRRLAQGVIASAREQASQLVARARVEAERILADTAHRVAQDQTAARGAAVTQIEHARRQAEAEGFAKGVQEGQARHQALIDNLAGVLDHLARQREEILQRSRRDILQFVLEVVERVFQIHDEVLSEVLAAQLSPLVDEASATPVIFVVNPADAPAVQSRLAAGAATEDTALALGARARVRIDEAVPRGECRVRGEKINLDVSFKDSFAQIRQRVLSLLG